MTKLQTQIAAFLRITKMSASRFGRIVAGDPHLVKQIDAGRVPGSDLSKRIAALLKRRDDYKRTPISAWPLL